MTFQILKKLIESNHIPDNVVLMSDSGWECDATQMDGVFYCEEDNILVFTMLGSDHDEYSRDKRWKRLWCAKAECNINALIECWADDDVKLYLQPLNYKAESIEEKILSILENYSYSEQLFPFGEKTTSLYQFLFTIIACVISARNNGEIIGYIGFAKVDGDLEMAVYIYDEYRRKRYGEAAVRNLVKTAFDNKLKYYDGFKQEEIVVKPDRIYAMARKEDVSYRALLEKCGFKNACYDAENGNEYHSRLFDQREDMVSYMQ